MNTSLSQDKLKKYIPYIAAGILCVVFLSQCVFGGSSSVPTNQDITGLMYKNYQSKNYYKKARNAQCLKEKSGWYFCSYNEYTRYGDNENNDVKMIHIIKLGDMIYAQQASSPTDFK